MNFHVQLNLRTLNQSLLQISQASQLQCYVLVDMPHATEYNHLCLDYSVQPFDGEEVSVQHCRNKAQKFANNNNKNATIVNMITSWILLLLYCVLVAAVLYYNIIAKYVYNSHRVFPCLAATCSGVSSWEFFESTDTFPFKRKFTTVRFPFAVAICNGVFFFES